MDTQSIFFSHSHNDNNWCQEFVTCLQASGYDVWYDEKGIDLGDAWIETIQHELTTRQIFLLILTPEAWASKWVHDELQLALATRKRIIPIMLKPTEVEGFILIRQWVNAIGKSPDFVASVLIGKLKNKEHAAARHGVVRRLRDHLCGESCLLWVTPSTGGLDA